MSSAVVPYVLWVDPAERELNQLSHLGDILLDLLVDFVLWREHYRRQLPVLD